MQIIFTDISGVDISHNGKCSEVFSIRELGALLQPSIYFFNKNFMSLFDKKKNAI